MNTEANSGPLREPPAAAAGAAAQSPTLQRRLPPFDALLLTLSCLSPVFSVYGPGSDILQHTGTGAAALFLIGIGAAAIWAMVYAELGSAYPYAGGDYVGVGSILGPAAGFASLALWALVILPINAFLAKMVVIHLAEAMPVQPVGAAYIAIAVAAGIALLAVRSGAVLTGIFLCISLLTVIALLVAALGWYRFVLSRRPGGWAPRIGEH